MDQELLDLMDLQANNQVEVRLLVDKQAVEVSTTEGPRTHPLRPLDQLYGKGTGLSSLDGRDQQVQPLLLAIELPITEYYADHPRLTDGQVLLSLKLLSMNPAAAATDELAHGILVSLRLALSINDYSRQDVKMALRKIGQSVERHMKEAGTRGYLTFISQYLRP
jgi:hypothetical protein